MSSKQLLKQAATAFDRIVPPASGVTVLIYHRTGGGSGGEVDLAPDVFDAQLEYLVEHHRVVSLDTAVAELAEHGDNTPAVVITFDDGTSDFAEHAVPILERHRLPATLYVATEFIEDGTAFPWGAPPVSWSALRDAVSTGLVTVGSHTHTHRLLDRLPSNEVASDLDRSIELIGERLGVQADHFAYPKAVPPTPVAEIEVRRRFESAALASSRVNRPGSCDPLRLWRTPIQASDRPEQFAAKAAGGLRLEGAARALAATVRYRGSGR